MSKVSKTIKKLRAAQGLTQDALAEKLFITRQTVSSWENDRTQPDIEMLKMLSEAFGVSIEELIYGEKRRTDPNAENDKTRKILTTVFAVLASALVGAGLVLIFVAGWQNFSALLKTVFAFVPMLAGQALALYTYLKRRKSIAWREGASVLLCAGIAGTVAMIDSIYSLSSNFLDCMLIDALLILPVIYLLDAAAPLIFYYITAIYYGFSLAESYGEPLLLLMPLLFVLGLGYVILNRKKTDDMRHIYTVWISACAAAAIIVLSAITITYNFIAAVTIAFIGIYALEKKNFRYYPFKTLGIVSTAVISALIVHEWQPIDSRYRFHWGRSNQIDIAALVFTLIVVIAAIVCIIIGRSSFKKDIPKTVFCISAALCAVTAAITLEADLYGTMPVYIIVFGLTLVQAISMVVKGAKELSFIPLNVGLILIGVLLSYIIYEFDISLFGMGLLLVALGIILFFINFKTAKKIKGKKEAEANA